MCISSRYFYTKFHYMQVEYINDNNFLKEKSNISEKISETLKL